MAVLWIIFAIYLRRKSWGKNVKGKWESGKIILKWVMRDISLMCKGCLQIYTKKK